jgi:hypothetical protein
MVIVLRLYAQNINSTKLALIVLNANFCETIFRKKKSAVRIDFQTALFFSGSHLP